MGKMKNQTAARQRHQHVKVASLCYMSHSSVFRSFCEPFRNAVFNSVQEKESIIPISLG